MMHQVNLLLPVDVRRQSVPLVSNNALDFDVDNIRDDSKVCYEERSTASIDENSHRGADKLYEPLS